jgi:RimJ/RimL family protein N-acetyltransferase
VNELHFLECTFIISLKGEIQDFHPCRYIDSIVGDVNLFFNDYNSDKSCEVNVMVAEVSQRRKGIAKEAIILLMQYGINRLSVQRFYCKIHETNEASLQLFICLGYREVNYVQAFQEFELEFLVDRDLLETLPFCSSVRESNYQEQIIHG